MLVCVCSHPLINRALMSKRPLDNRNWHVDELLLASLLASLVILPEARFASQSQLCVKIQPLWPQRSRAQFQRERERLSLFVTVANED